MVVRASSGADAGRTTPVQGYSFPTPDSHEVTHLTRIAIQPLPFRNRRHNTSHTSIRCPENHTPNLLLNEKLCTYPPYPVQSSPQVSESVGERVPPPPRTPPTPVKYPRHVGQCPSRPKTPREVPVRGQPITGNRYPRRLETSPSRKPDELPETAALCKNTSRLRRDHAPPAFAAAPMHPVCPARPRTRILSRGLGPHQSAAPAPPWFGPIAAPEQIRKPETS